MVLSQGFTQNNIKNFLTMELMIVMTMVVLSVTKPSKGIRFQSLDCTMIILIWKPFANVTIGIKPRVGPNLMPSGVR